MNLSLIACIDNNSAIGFDGKLLWRHKEDLNWFKQHTINKPIIMGRKTYQSIGKPLPQRANIILTKDTTYSPHPDVLIRHDLSATLHEFRNEKEIFCIGGQQLYSLLLPFADRLYLTRVHHKFEHTDTHFPYINEQEWKEYYFKENKEKSKYPLSFHVYKRSDQ